MTLMAFELRSLESNLRKYNTIGTGIQLIDNWLGKKTSEYAALFQMAEPSASTCYWNK